MFDHARTLSFLVGGTLALGALGCSMSMAPSDAPGDSGPGDAPRRDAYVVIIDGAYIPDGAPGLDGGLHLDALEELPDGSLADGALRDAAWRDGSPDDVTNLDGYFPDGSTWDASLTDAPPRDGQAGDIGLGFDGSGGPTGPPCGGGFCDLSMICCPGDPPPPRVPPI